MRGYSSDKFTGLNLHSNNDVSSLDKESCIRYLSMWPTGQLAESMKLRLRELGVAQSELTQHSFVDLGLPSGTLWATNNIGAILQEDAGDFFSWGEVEPKQKFVRRNYRYSNGFFKTAYSKYDPSVDNLTDLQDGDDAASTLWGASWRTPSFEQWTELNKECKIITSNFTKKLRLLGPNGNQLLFPLEGYMRWDNKLTSPFFGGCYLSSSLGYAEVCIGGISCNDFSIYKRHYGFMIRPVRQKDR